MTDLAEFLLARIAEDEHEAHSAGSGQWSWRQGFGEKCNDPTCPFGSLISADAAGALTRLMDVHGYDVHEGWEGAAHIARHDPARVLAECEAKRRIVEEHRPDRESRRCGCCWLEDLETWEPYRCPTLRALALPYADHPDYKESWKAMNADLAEFLTARYADEESHLHEDEYGAADYAGGHTDRCIYEGGYEGTHRCDCGAVERRLADLKAKRQIIEWHKSWPVFVETRPDLTVMADDVMSAVASMTKQIAWMTEQEYVARFGTEAPTGPILRLLALPYADHPDYREEWRP